MTNEEMEKEIERLRVQLAGCGVAALGCVSDVANKGDYGWSQSYADVLNLRKTFDVTREYVRKSIELLSVVSDKNA